MIVNVVSVLLQLSLVEKESLLSALSPTPLCVLIRKIKHGQGTLLETLEADKANQLIFLAKNLDRGVVSSNSYLLSLRQTLTLSCYFDY